MYANETIAGIQFKATDTLWSRNFKRAIASTFQLKNLKSGAFVENEVKNIALNLWTKMSALSSMPFLLVFVCVLWF